MLTAILIVLIGLLSMRHSGENRYAILLFAIMCGSFQIFHENILYLVGYQYYLGAALIDSLIIVLLSKTINLTSTIISLQSISLCFIYVNLFGWLIYELYIGPIMYDSLCAALFLAALFESARRGKSDDLGNFTAYNGSHFFFIHHNISSHALQDNKKTQRS